MAQNGVPSNGHVEGQGSGFPDYRRNIMMQHVKQGYTLFFRHALTLLLVPVAALLAIELATMLQSGKLKAIWDGAVATDVQFNLMTFMATSALLLLVALSYVLLQRRPVYLLDFAVFKPPEQYVPYQHTCARAVTNLFSLLVALFGLIVAARR